MDVVAQILPPHYSPLSQAESDLAVGPYGIIMAVNFLNRGLLSAEFLGGFGGFVKLQGDNTMRYRAGQVAFGAWSLCSFLLAFFPTDVPPASPTWHGAIHLLLAVIAFGGGALGAVALSFRLPRSGVLASVRKVAIPFAVASAVALLVELGAPALAPRLAADYGGLLERIFLASVLAWIVAVAFSMYRKVRNATSP